LTRPDLVDVSNWVAVTSQQGGAGWRLYSSGFGAEGVVEVQVFGDVNAACAFYTDQGLQVRVLRMGNLNEMHGALDQLPASRARA
jgi:hypothetical protein